VDYWVGRLGIAKGANERANAFKAGQPQVPGSACLDRFQVDVPVEPRQRLA
jgi:hypothetical protein